ncbi:MAG: response regulator [Opitutaceae bacterium]|nr:response regulator [Verrucomicrobiales bacterium]
MNKVSRTSLKKILLVEDNYKDAELTLSALAANNLANEVISVHDGVEALDYLHCEGRFAGRTDGDPLVVFLDLKMPKLDGLEVLRRMKSDEKLRVIPVVMLTSSREENDLVTCYRLGVNAYVVKPVDFQQFVLAVKQAGMFWAAVNEPVP